jgi:hypothetical protein
MVLASLGVLAPALQGAGGGDAAWAQVVTSARLVGTPAPAEAGSASSAGTSTVSGSTGAAAGAPAPSGTTHPAAGAGANAAIGVGGRVVASASHLAPLAPLAPLATAAVYAYQLASLTLLKVETDPQGNFLFRNLPAGLYKIIASKPGFLPAVTLLTRTTAKAYQSLELQLAQRDAGAAGAVRPAANTGTNGASPEDADFWALRARIPSDVLRDIDAAEVPDSPESPGSSTKSARAALPPGTEGELAPGTTIALGSPAGATDTLAANRFRTEVQAMTGIADVAQVGIGQASLGKLGIQGQLGAVQVGLSGRFWQMTSDGPLPGTQRSPVESTADGLSSALSLNLQAGPSSRITVDSISDHLLPRTSAGLGEPVGLDHYGVSWSQSLGESSRSDFTAQYTSESNYHRQSLTDPAVVPDASRTWTVNGAYTTAVGDDGSLQTGFRYSELQVGLPTVGTASSLSGSGLAPLPAISAPGLSNAATSAVSGLAISPGHQTADFFSRASSRLAPAFMVEYGLYTTLQDGSLSLAPQGGLVLQMDGGWQIKGSASQRIYQETAVSPEFLPTLYNESTLCEQGSKACYELSLARRSGDDDAVTFSAIERIVGQTLQLYFSDVVTDRLESLYLVPGDRLPELHMVVSRRISPQVRTSFESSLASGGGGTFIAADGRPYLNQVRYLVTSLDTRFLNTATGVFVAFHHMTQNLGPLASLPGAVPAQLSSSPGGANTVSFDRLQVMLSQDLNFLWNIASEWAFQLNMELDRGLPPYMVTSDNTQLHRSILGGIAIKF